MHRLAVFVVLIPLWATNVNAQNVPTGTITGSVSDAETGEALIGVNIILAGKTIGAASDLDGRYVIRNVPAGTYSLFASMIGYQRKKISDVKVAGDAVTRVDIMLHQEAYKVDEIVIKAKSLNDNELSLLRRRGKASSVSDAISAESMSRFAASTAATAMTHVTGASLMDGKYVVIRGLGNRYTTAALNGNELPSSDPDKKAVQLDMIPASLLANIVAVKTFTPDRPGNFSGGSININTKDFPEQFLTKISLSSSFNTETQFGASFLTYPGGSLDWIGMDDGSRQMPAILNDPGAKVPDIGSAYTDPEKAKLLDEMTRAFNTSMSPVSRRAPLNQSYSISMGGKTSLFNNPLGVIGSLSYSRNYTSYQNGTAGRWQLTGDVAGVQELVNDFLLNSNKSTDNVLWGGMAKLSYKLSQNHTVEANFMYTRSGESMARYQYGAFPRDLSGNATYETRTLKYTERRLQSFQLNGEHHFDALPGIEVDWAGGLSNSYQDEPDTRFFTDNYTIVERNGQLETKYAIRPSIYSFPTRYFRTMNENDVNGRMSVAVPFPSWSGEKGTMKIGGYLSMKNRTFTERRFEFRQDKIRYNGNPDDFFQSNNMGILSRYSGGNFYRFGNYVVDLSQLSNNYNG
ncbi:MAG: TonB-dependent receptor, partial [Chlorobi bacterium]|nr:TonB-dependent receptor [Chlorobiota bacterium]